MAGIALFIGLKTFDLYMVQRYSRRSKHTFTQLE